ncbi:transposase [Alteribacter populi]|uniref:transposase n=1 Tax=Alteribacter populi TaxID=2011011 RepID=UPI000BBABF48|nr:transposase [Alteribacter populi]
MSRKLRVWYPGAMYHITARGNRRTPLFEETKDYLKYLAILEDVKSKSPFFLHSYCLMTYHIHLLLETTTFPIQGIMNQLQSRYANWFNKDKGYIGHLFQGRYGANIIKTDDDFLEISRYIHLMPLEAKMVHHPQDYPWSSYRAFISPIHTPHVRTTKILSNFANPQQARYQQFVEAK